MPSLLSAVLSEATGVSFRELIFRIVAPAPSTCGPCG